uniref:Integrase catalytic domain-containing protein n=1 Tax=Chromera velia CCMP2878 TaxID=1169474 RepID=A0A0G4GR37_9ALVE|eukprot:Cvel_23004.t1-p1 / transcript=Cvel_23004.t1 / gene=Cvel_23004 / organism=Chromera_velia_CCMP2878 / gene_product=Pol polyprotein, putative / transcript_product=Pol polyprotein, putative / location=Cvel_scaffold2322:5839-7455(+) / protein_length=539 / sequence_SO=supercontig / SO=protein_coding / is_pseudo=false
MQVHRPARSIQREFWESDIAYLDTGASRSIFSEYYRKYVIWSEEINREINQAETGVKLKVHEDALFRFPFIEKQMSLYMPVHHRAYLVRDREDGSPSVEPLFGPMETAADSWFTIIDAVSGELKEFHIDCSRGDSSCNIPYVVMQNAKRVYASPYRLFAVFYETAMTWHRRLLHCGEERLVGTLKKNSLVAWRDVLDKVWKNCDICEQSNAMRPTLPRSRHRCDGKKFGKEWWWDLMFMKEVGHGGVHIISVLVKLLDQWWSLRVLKSVIKDEADQHLLHLIIAEQIIPKIIRSDNDTMLKLGKTKQLAAEYNIYLKPSLPHCPESHGAVEVTNREIRTMLRTTLKEIGCDAYVWPVLIPGIEQTHNVTFAPLTGMTPSPWFGRFQSPPPFVLHFGDTIIFKPPSADKSLSFFGMKGVFINTVNDTKSLYEVLYYPPETERWTVCKLHSIVPKPVRRGVEEAWLGRAARRTGRGNGVGVGGGTGDGKKNKYGCNYYKDMNYKFEEIPEPMVPLVSVEEVSPSRPVRGALAEIDGVLQPV